MNILGLSAYSHESAACVLKDGVAAALVEEERLNREKHTWRFPEKSISEVLRIAGLAASDVSEVAYFWQPWREVSGNAAHVLRYLPASLNLLRASSDARGVTLLERTRLHAGVGSRLKEWWPKKAPRVRHVEHHLCHAASAFFPSPFERAAILTLDGRGEDATTLWALGQDRSIAKLRAQRVPHSLGHLYAAVTDFLGFDAFSDEWKVMGLSAYGTPRYAPLFEEILAVDPDGGFRLDLSYFQFHTHGRSRWVSRKFTDRLGPPRERGAELDQRHSDVAYALQKSIERAGLRIASALHERTGADRLCLAGGVALNCLMNKVIIEQGPFREVFIQPIAHDAGAALGSALYVHHQLSGNPRREPSPASVYLGPGYTAEEIASALKSAGLEHRRSADVAAEAASAVAAGKIVGWFQGRMEAGPRALGNRSLLADPRRADMKDVLNRRVKRREGFRPFAPAVTAEAAREFFDLKQDSPYMVVAADVKEEKKAVIPAVVHRDGTARVQTVARGDNPLFWSLLKELDRLTGVPVVLNTSFNENEPIVCSPRDAVECFLRAGVDLLAIGDFIVERRTERGPLHG